MFFTIFALKDMGRSRGNSLLQPVIILMVIAVDLLLLRPLHGHLVVILVLVLVLVAAANSFLLRGE